MAIRESAFRTLEKVAQIKTKQERIDALREVCAERPALAMAIQYAYHPDVQFDLPEGPLPENIFKPATHDEFGNFYQNVKKLRNYFTTSPVPRRKKEMNFVVLCETICAIDLPLLMGIKDKKLPWRTLNKSFCVKALPELFPNNMKVEEEEAA